MTAFSFHASYFPQNPTGYNPTHVNLEPYPPLPPTPLLNRHLSQPSFHIPLTYPTSTFFDTPLRLSLALQPPSTTLVYNYVPPKDPAATAKARAD